MRKTKLAVVVALAVCSLSAFGQAKKSDWSVTGNAALFSDYRFRGFTQTGYGPAFQGGFDVAHSSGFYAGNWNSNVEQGLYNGASLEMDLYAGYKGTFGQIGYDVGYLYYYYPKSGAFDFPKIRNGEIYAGASFGPVTAKWFYSTTKFFSLGEPVPLIGGGSTPEIDTKGSWYFDVTGTLDFGAGFGGNAHIGYQKIENGKTLFANGLTFANENSVIDYKLGGTYDLSGWLLGASIIGTTEKALFRTAESGFTKDGGKTRLVLSVGKTF